MEQNNIPDYRAYIDRESRIKHENYEFEKNIYKMITSGDVKGLEKNRLKYSDASSESPSADKGALSDDPIRSEQYHMAIYTANVARSCIEAGMPQEQAFSLSDYYIRLADQVKEISTIRQLSEQMAADYCQQMSDINRRAKYSPAVKQTIEYVCDNLDRHFTIDELSELTGYNRSYLSLLFKKETNITIQDFIMKKRIDTAKNMLRLTNYSYSQIAAALAFSSQSYFCRQFKSVAGCTPKEYKIQFSET